MKNKSNTKLFELFNSVNWETTKIIILKIELFFLSSCLGGNRNFKN